MSQRPRRRTVALLLALVPGWGHVYWGREALGLAIFTVAAVFGFAWINGRFVYRGEGREVLVWTAGLLALAVLAGSFLDVFLRTMPSRRRREEEAHDHLLRQGMVAYLKGDFKAADLLFRECLRIDPQDVEALFRLGVTCARQGDRRQARRWLRRTRRHDLEDKWIWEVGRELRFLEEEAKKDDGAGEAAPDGEENTEGKTERAEPASA